MIFRDSKMNYLKVKKFLEQEANEVTIRVTNKALLKK